MKKIKILLFDLDPQNGAGADFGKLLGASTALLEIKHKLVNASEMPQAARHLCSVISKFAPDLTCFVFGTTSHVPMEEIFAAVRGGRVAQPVIAVVNTGEQKDVAAALYHGSNDFLIPPFRALEVLPRVLRWVEEARQDDTSIQSLKDTMGLKKLIGESPAFLTEIKKIPAAARCCQRRNESGGKLVV